MEDDIGTDLARQLFERAKASGVRGNLGFVYDEISCPMDIRIWGNTYIGFFGRVEGNVNKVHILVYDSAVGEKARDSLMWMDNYVESGSVNEGEFRLRVGENEKKVVDHVRVKRGGGGFLEVVLKGKPSNKEVFNAMLGCAIAPLMDAIKAATREG